MAEEDDLDLIPGIYKLFDANGIWVHQGEFPCYFRNAALADHQCGVWADTIHNLGFSGIHWDTLGTNAGNYDDEASGTYAYLNRALQNLAPLGLPQILNFSGTNPSETAPAWWDPTLVTNGVIAFPFFEVYTMAHEQLCYQAMTDPRLVNASPFPIWGVLAFYPYYNHPSGDLNGEPWSDSDVFLARWYYAPQNRLVYEGIGDGEQRLEREYLPDNVPLSTYERDVLLLDHALAPPRVSWLT
jgi:hypothetical protein